MLLGVVGFPEMVHPIRLRHFDDFVVFDFGVVLSFARSHRNLTGRDSKACLYPPFQIPIVTTSIAQKMKA